jgi:hypothetical protein
MRRLALLLAALTAAMVIAAAPVAAITYGEPDDGEHPYVGFMIFYVPAEDAWFSCSGTLLDADTFLTAAHCTFDIGIEGEEPPETGSGGTDVWVTFDETEVLAGWPLRSEIGTVYPDVEALNAARRAWLDDPDNGFIGGTAFPNPQYATSRFPVNYDVGIVELDDPVFMSNYGDLAPLGTAETLAGEASTRNSALVETVGYGIQAVQPHPMDIESRYKATSRIVQINGSIARGGNLHTLNNPSAVGGTGGSCFGDSGGPVLINNTDDVIAVVSFGFSLTCHGADYSWRVDTQPAYDFILPFLAM